MKIVIVNDIHVGKALIHNGKVRASSHLIESRLEGFLKAIFQLHTPDVVVNLGDLIRSESKEQDLKIYSRQLAHFKNIKSFVIHLIGNHEIKKLIQEDIKNAWLENGFKQKAYGCQEIGGNLIVWLGLELYSDRHVLLESQIEWLNRTLQATDKKVIIFSHYPIDDHDTTGNFFFEAMDNKSKQDLFLYNQHEVRKIIQLHQNVKAVFQAHLHYFHVNIVQNVPYITCPAMGDNICGPQAIDNIPEVYTTVDLDNNKIVVKAYSREYCFAGYEQCF
jgi:3',5'-cyclic-AMP phosphodiesterase